MSGAIPPEVRGSHLAGQLERARALRWLSRHAAKRTERHVQLELGEVLTVSVAQPAAPPVAEEESREETEEMANSETGTSGVLTPDAGWIPKASRPTAAFVKITPKLAAAWLEVNTRNRKQSADAIDRYDRTMGAGAWLPSCQGIGFDRNGTLADGQHRLVAVVRHGKPVVMLVVWGLDPAIVGVLDEQRRRTAGNLLQILGEDNANRRAAVARGIYLIATAFNVFPSNQETLATLEKHRDGVDWVLSLQTAASVSLDKKLPGDISATFVVAWERDHKRIDRLVRDVWEGTSLEKGSPAWALVRYLRVLQSDEKKQTKLDTQVDKLCKVLRACYAAVKGERDIAQLKISTTVNEYYLSNRRNLLP